MATVDFYIWKRPSKDRKYPISVRITINRKPSYIMTGQTLDNLEQWDVKRQRVKNSHDNHVRLNNYLRNELSKANYKALEMETKGVTSAKDVKISLKPVEEKKIYFKQIADQYLADQQACGNYDVFKTDRSRLKRFYEFSKNGEVAFTDITDDYLQRYIVFLRTAKKFRHNKNSAIKPLSERTITNHLIIIRTIFNSAITAKITSKDNYPFGEDGKISIKLSESPKIGLDELEIERLISLDLSQYSTIYNDARNI